MDKDLLRIVIIAIGALVIAGMGLWSFFKNRNTKRGIDFYDKGHPLENIDKSLILNTEHDDFDIVPLGSALDDELDVDPVSTTSEEDQYEEQEYYEEQLDKVDLPKIIQFSIVASADEGFNGLNLIEAFDKVGLEYGSNKIFERLDDQRRVDFAVASMVEPGTFPNTTLESFSSPGIVFFLQPGELDSPLEVFEEFIQTINMLAAELDGVKWDHNRQPLSDETVQQFRMQLSLA
ncbi:MAG: cell division protein ZipA C-terminal FtsZ-binding domain-containing protein [Methylococcales bacterium]|nr:cell division protein ZipA C-terminal FtsZ-binding domain-containing protein [Methylococcales bacterium]